MDSVELAVKFPYKFRVCGKFSSCENKSIPNAELLGRIAAALDTTTDYLVGRTPDNSPYYRGKNWVQLSDGEQLLLSHYKLLSEKNRIKAHERIQTLLDEQKTVGYNQSNNKK